MLAKLGSDAVRITTRFVETAFKETWAKLDAASDKPRPSEYLGKRAVQAIQGRRETQ